MGARVRTVARSPLAALITGLALLAVALPHSVPVAGAAGVVECSGWFPTEGSYRFEPPLTRTAGPGTINITLTLSCVGAFAPCAPFDVCAGRMSNTDTSTADYVGDCEHVFYGDGLEIFGGTLVFGGVPAAVTDPVTFGPQAAVAVLEPDEVCNEHVADVVFFGYAAVPFTGP